MEEITEKQREDKITLFVKVFNTVGSITDKNIDNWKKVALYNLNKEYTFPEQKAMSTELAQIELQMIDKVIQLNEMATKWQQALEKGTKSLKEMCDKDLVEQCKTGMPVVNTKGAC